MNLSTTYLGFKLPHPLMPGASPLVDDLDQVRRLEDAGACAIVMHSLFEEQIVAEQLSTHFTTAPHEEAFPEASSFLPRSEEFVLGPDPYLEQIRKIKAAVGVPVIASLNGTSLGGWLDYARLIQEAGADALELNVYGLSTSLKQSGAQIEKRTAEMVQHLRASVRIPVAVKLSPTYTALPEFASQLRNAGAGGLVLFNRFYQPEIDIENLEIKRVLHLSDSSELNLRIRWLAVLAGRVGCSLAASGGIHTGAGAIKALMAGADVVQTVSALLRHGPGRLRVILDELRHWLEAHEYESLDQLKGSMSLLRCPDPEGYERANYVRLLQSWRDLRQSGSVIP